ncbi:dienelactone hydrolase family protein [uncultured Tolumonas sp.]|uniref:alpha/beta hydrolase n=1 Tax=uncultured Tolumonas sp. TaxID=263765 RepID=UPI002A0A4F25|nr:dienelactone hydrolase family protein [uncultured Tolumonas sp.]
MTKQVVILLHGVGSNGDDLQALARYWSQELPDTLFLSPNAPFRFDQGFGYQWFSVNGITPETRAARIVSARSEFNATINRLFSEHAINPDLDRVVFVGFSQGTIMALDALVSARFPLAGVVAYSGRLASPEPFIKSEKATPVILIHGKNDPVIPYTESEAAANKLIELGFEVQTHYESGAVHTITNAGVALALTFIKRCFS